MQVLIDNFDGLGKVDYSAVIQFGKGATIARALNKPTMCRLPMVPGNSLQVPAQGARVRIADVSGRSLFTGYVAGAPAVGAAGEQTSGLVQAAAITAVSDEAVLDAGVSTAGTTLLGQTAQQNWGSLSALPGKGGLPVSLSDQMGNASRLQVEQGARWSEAAGALAGSTRSAYRALDGAISVAPVGQVAHEVASSDAGLKLASLDQADLHLLAQDVTVLGREEPRAYVTELFQGDGVTTSFALSEKPFAPVAQQKTMISDLFQGTSLNPQVWKIADAPGHIALTAGGLSCLGGSGRDGESSVASVQQIELGGSITIEGGGVQLSAGSVGTVLGLYAGAVETSACFAGFQASSSGSGVSVSPVINEVVSGSAFAVAADRQYTFRLRVFSAEVERVRQRYFFLGGALGGETVPSAGWLQFEVQDVTSGTPSVPVVLYSGTVTELPASCVLGLLCSGSLVCSVKTISCTQAGPLWVGAGASGSSALTIGPAVDGAACHIASTGTLDFYPASIPGAGALISVLYRTRGRSAARQAVQPGLSGQGQPVSAWVGTVTHPPAWSSVDCEYAAGALLGMVSGGEAGLKGTYSVKSVEGGEDFWPGDTVKASGTPPSLTIRSAELTLLGGDPALVAYKLEFANDWIEGLSLRVSNSVSQDTVLPQSPTEYGSALGSLSSLSVTGTTGSVLTIAAGATAPINGGFEVRRRDDTFGPGTDSDLVLRTAVSNFSIPRAAAREQYFVRMYDGANPPNYSLLSAAVFINVPM